MGSNTGVTVHKIKIDKPACRAMAVEFTGDDSGVLSFPFSSTQPGRQYFGTEILSHERGAINFDRMNSGSAPHLFNHREDQVLGVNKRGWLEDRGMAEVLFDLEDELPRKIYSKIKRGILRNVSTYYTIDEYEEKYDEAKREQYVLVTKWTPVETSTVSIPVDHTVGYGRSLDQIIWTPNYLSQSHDKIETDESGVSSMPETETVQSPTVLTDDDLQAARKQAQKDERTRMEGIRGLIKDYGDRHPNIKRKAEEAMSEGWSIETTKSAIAEIILGDGEERPPIQGPASRAMDESEQKDYSLFRAVRAATNKGAEPIEKIAPFELEVSNRIADQLGRSTTGIFLPVRDLVMPQNGQRGLRLTDGKRASFNVGTANQGGNLVENALKEELMVEYLFNRPMVTQAGATIITGLRGDFDFPVEDASAVGIDWLGEDVAANEKNSTFTLKNMTPRHAAAYMRVTEKMMRQSEIAMEPYMRQLLAKVMSLGVDQACINGSGTGNEPRGILNTAGINTVVLGDPNGGVLTWPKIVELETVIADQNADVGSMCLMTNAKVKGDLKTIEKATDTGLFIWENDRVNGYPAKITQQIPNNLTKGTGVNLSAGIFGVFSELMIGQWGVVEIMSNPYGDDDFRKGAIKVRIAFYMDIQISHEESFSVFTDAVTAA